MSRPCLIATTALLGALALPAAASAATFTVDPAAATGCDANRTCKEIGSALNDARLAAGDEVVVRKGAYTEPSLTVAKPNVVLRAETPGTVAITGTSPTAAAINLSGAGAQLKGVIVASAPNGGAVVAVTAPGTTIDGAVLARLATTTVDAPAVQVIDSGVNGGTTTVSNSFVLNTPKNSPATTSAAVSGTPDSSIALVGTIVLSGDNQGSALALPGGDVTGSTPVANTITRSSLFGGKQGAHGIEAVTTGARAKAIRIDSSIVAPGPGGAALLVSTPDDSPLQPAAAGAVTVTATHATLAGAGRAFDLQGINSTGNITATFDRSIVRGTQASTVASFPGSGIPAPLPGAQPATTSSATITNSDTNVAAATGAAPIAVSSSSNTPDDRLFVGNATRDFHLRPDAPVIDKGGAQVAGESDKDVDGEVRVNGAASDLGGDEYVNKPPLVKLALNNDKPIQGQQVTFAAEAADPEAKVGGGIVRYAWDFGDGTTTETTEPTVAHAYTGTGPKEVRVTVFDNGGAQSTSAPRTLEVRDGIGPTVTLTAPKTGKTFNLYKVTKKKVVLRKKGKVLRDKKGKARTRTVTTRKANKIAIKGTAADPSGVVKVELTLRRIGTSTTQCTYFDGKGAFIVASCKKPRSFPIRFRNGAFAYNLKATSKVKKGKYEVAIRATDGGGVVSNATVSTITLK